LTWTTCREEILTALSGLKYIKEPAYFEMGDGEEALILPYPKSSQETGLLRIIFEPGAPDGFRLPEYDNRPNPHLVDRIRRFDPFDCRASD
jgi:hypothetical protein